MLAQYLASEEIPFLKTTDTVEKANNWMDEFKVSHLPVVKEGDFIGMVSENTLLDIADWTQPLSQHELSLTKISVLDTDHVFDILKNMAESGLTTIAITNKYGKYAGAATISQIVNVVGEMSMVKDPGGIIELEMNANDYSMGEISQIVESDNAKILGCYVTTSPDSKKLRVTVKVNKNNILPILQTFERYQYNVTASFFEEVHTDVVKDRYNNLMRYLNT